MCRKAIGNLLVLTFIVLLIPAFAEEMIVKKITLGRFTTKNSNIVLSKGDPYWPEINRHNLTVDDKGYIYVLNLLNQEIMVFNRNGIISKRIPLPVEPLKKKLVGYGKLEVSGDGKLIFVNIPPSEGFAYEPDFVKSSGLTLNNKGKIIKREGFPEVDVRLCNKTFVFLQGGYVYDENFNLKGQFSGFTDSEGKYKIDVKRHLLIKYAHDGKILWEKQFAGNFGIIGIDLNNYIYIHGILRKGAPDSLYKLNSKGEIVAQAPIPDPFPYLTREEKDEDEARSSEDFLSFFKLACNGDVYLIFQLGELPSLTYKRWLKGGEYFIYKFETKK